MKKVSLGEMLDKVQEKFVDEPPYPHDRLRLSSGLWCPTCREWVDNEGEEE